MIVKRDTNEIKQMVGHSFEVSSDSAIIILKAALLASEQAGYMHGKIISLYRLGNLYSNLGSYQLAMNTYKQTLQYVFSSPRNRHLLPAIYNNIGQMLGLQGNFKEAAEALYLAASLNHLYPPNSGGYSYLNIAGLLMSMPDAENANAEKILYYLNLAEQQGKKNNNPLLVAYALHNKGAFFMKDKNYEKAWSYFNQAWALADSNQLVEIKKATLVSLGELKLMQNAYEDAMHYLLMGKEIQQNQQPYYMNMNDVYLAKAYLQLKKYRLAGNVLLEAKEYAKKYALNNNLLEIYQTLIHLYKETGKYAQALSYYERYLELKEELTGRETAERLNNLEVKFTMSEKDKDLSIKQLKITQQEKRLIQKNVTIYGIAVVLILLTTFIVFYYKYNERKHKLHQEQIQNIQQREKIIQLKAIMNGEEKERARIGRELHDGIGGMLASIKLNLSSIKNEKMDLMQVEKINSAMKELHQTVTEIRKTAHNLMPEVLEKHNFTDALVMYCDSVSTTDLEIDIQIYGNWNTLNKEAGLMIYRIIQELCQNILKHSEATEAVVQLMEQNSKATLMVEDNGKGFDTDSDIQKGIGLQNIRHRVQALGGKINITSRHTIGTIVNIEFEFNDKLLC